MTARIHRPARSAMQSGTANVKDWRLDYEPERAREIEPLMGWTSSGDMRSQIHLTFDTAEEAVAYAVRNGIPYRVEAALEPTRKFQTYSDNFKYSRSGQWTH